MSHNFSYTSFIFESYDFDASTNTATFRYSFDSERYFSESVQFSASDSYNRSTLDNAVRMAWIIAGISYYKTFPTRAVIVRGMKLTAMQAEFFSVVYLHGLSQYVYENNLQPTDIASFQAESSEVINPDKYSGSGILALQSGGKDSLLLAQLLKVNRHDFTTWYMAQSPEYPAVLDTIGKPLRLIRRAIDKKALAIAKEDGGLNGHVPVTYITLSYAIIDAILHNENKILAAIGTEGEEPHAYIGEYPVTHQWSKTWNAEQLLANYVSNNIADEIRVGSPLRELTELRVSELFVENLWSQVGHLFSSCNAANYKQDTLNQDLSWCCECPKCANSYILFAPFVSQNKLNEVFGRDLFRNDELTEVFKGLLGVDGVEKPFECVGEIEELRSAYYRALDNGYHTLPFDVPKSTFEYLTKSHSQTWASRMIQ